MNQIVNTSLKSAGLQANLADLSLGSVYSFLSLLFHRVLSRQSCGWIIFRLVVLTLFLSDLSL